MKNLRLTFPQWQGAGQEVVQQLVTELPIEQSRQGYMLGSQLLDFLAPKTQSVTRQVAVSKQWETPEQQGILAYSAIYQQLQNAWAILQQEQPERVITLGGDCAVSVAPFAYLADKYADDVAIIWIDAHPDLNLPYDPYRGFHAMALAQIGGFGDANITATLPQHKIKLENALIVGLREFSNPAEQRRQDWGIASISSQAANQSSTPILQWLKQTGKSKVLIHLDLDVLDPNELKIAVGTDPNGMTLSAVSRVINDIAKQSDIVGFTIAEPMPREMIKLKGLLNSLPCWG
ncbi:arginase family protein [Volucribacter amazonae]|uniref:Arginase n=1 Tax=Volucribacter amazonae TaxID=256731 RepID=A0A9X4PCY8_9PAST|nr:arginase family protein [Volucribacter amazonae]MDG6895359.1 hypothetical protein [Volucribacter amazonae]